MMSRRMRRNLFTIASALSLLGCVFCGWIAVSVLVNGTRGTIYWDQARGEWVPISAQWIAASGWLSAALVAPFAVCPLLWLRRFLVGQHRRNRVWRGRCGSCGYDLRASTGCCSECGTPVPKEIPDNSDRVIRSIGPGTEATLVLLVTVPATTAVALALLLYLLLIIGGGA